MTEYIATFGYSHRLVPPGEDKLGIALRNRFVRVKAKDVNAAMAWMFETFGQQWSQIYLDEEAAGVQRFNLRELVV